MENPSQAITLSFPFSLRDRFRAAIVLTPYSKRAIAAALVWPVLGLSFLVFMLAKGRPLGWDTGILMLVALLFYPIMLVISTLLTHFNPQMREPFTYTFDDLGIHVSATTYEFTHRWPAISRVRRSGGFLLFFFSRQCAHCIPLSVVERAGVIGPLLALANQNGVSIEGL